MFSRQVNDFATVQSEGTTFLRNIIRTSIYSGDPVIENKLVAYQLFWKFYNNQHWAKNNDKLLSFNYARKFVDKVNSFLAGKNGFEHSIIDQFGGPVDATIEQNMEAFVNYVWRLNKKSVLIQKILQMGGITGDAYVFVYWDSTKKQVSYKLLDTRTTIPIFNDGDYSDVIGYKSVEILGTNDKKYVHKITEYKKDSWTTYFKKDAAENAEKYEVVTNTNELGFIPIVHIENNSMSDGYGGSSDIVDVIKVNKIYNEMAEDIKAIVDYYAKPVTVITGATVGQLKRGLNQIWSGLPAEATVTNLALNDDLSASQMFLQILKNSMHEMTDVPESVLGKTQQVSNTSAAALQILYHPIIEAADKKWLSYGSGIEDINNITFRLYAKFYATHELFAKIAAIDFERYRAVPVFTYGLPSDRLVTLNEAQIELQNGIASKKEIMERLGKKNIPKIQEEIRDEQVEDLEYQSAQMEIQGAAMCGMQPGEPGNVPPAISPVKKVPNKFQMKKVTQQELLGGQ